MSALDPQRMPERVISWCRLGDRVTALAIGTELAERMPWVAALAARLAVRLPHISAAPQQIGCRR